MSSLLTGEHKIREKEQCFRQREQHLQRPAGGGRGQWPEGTGQSTGMRSARWRGEDSRVRERREERERSTPL